MWEIFKRDIKFYDMFLKVCAASSATSLVSLAGSISSLPWALASPLPLPRMRLLAVALPLPAVLPGQPWIWPAPWLILAFNCFGFGFKSILIDLG